MDGDTEMIYCTANEAVDKAKESLQVLNDNSDCGQWQESDPPYNVYYEEHCDIDHPWNGDGCGETSYDLKKPSEDRRRHYIKLSDGDTEEAIRLLNRGVPFAMIIASISAAFYVGPYAPFVMAPAAFAVNHKAHNWAHKLEDKNTGCGVGVNIYHRKVLDSDRSNPFDDVFESGDDLRAGAYTQDDRVQ